MKKKPRITQLIKGAAARSDYTMLKLSDATGIPYPTINKRLAEPGGWRVYELKAIFKKLDFLPNEVEEIGKEIGLD